ncbi:expressed unknown protein [Seminavis robusta]|uniref:C2 domain-containing protein n=1 Tax=Seminavis robusta TaxID=568900 RepID=A0A9N8ES12_9STRA|nr:expressed unknown protein [Seminavis robusta]|eukprot:Sro1488_g276880.1 n/a (1540) ;mRNA; f:11196-15815
MTLLDRPSAVTAEMRTLSCAIHPDATLHLQLAGFHLTNVATGWVKARVSSPAFSVCAYRRSLDQWEPVATSQSIPAELNPVWPLVKVRCQDSCHSDMERPIRIQVFDQGQIDETKVPMGHFDTTVKELLNRSSGGFLDPNAFRFSLMQDQQQVGSVSVVLAVNEIEPLETQPTQQPEPRLEAVMEEAILATNADAPPEAPTNGVMGWFKRSSVAAAEEANPKEDQKTQNNNSPSRQSASSKQQQQQNHNKKEVTRTSPARSSASKRKETRQKDKQLLRLILRGENLEEMPVGIGQDVAVNRFCRIAKLQPGQQDDGSLFRDIFQSKVVPHNQNPTWEEWTLSLDELCGGDLDMPINFSLWEEQDRPVQMGSSQATVRELLHNKRQRQPMTLTKHSKSRTFGTLHVVQAEIIDKKAPVVVEEEEEKEEKRVSNGNNSPPIVLSKEQELNWMTRALNLAAGLVSQGEATGTETPPSEGDKDEKDDVGKEDAVEKKNDAKQEGEGPKQQPQRQQQRQQQEAPKRPDKKTADVHRIVNVLEALENVEKDDEDDDDSSSESSSDSDDDEDDDDDDITIADVISVAEQAMLHHGNQKQQQGLLELTQLLTPTRVSPKKRATAADIMAGMPKWDLDGDSVASGKSRRSKQHEQQSATGGKTKNKVSVVVAKVAPLKDQCDVAWSIQQKKDQERKDLERKDQERKDQERKDQERKDQDRKDQERKDQARKVVEDQESNDHLGKDPESTRVEPAKPAAALSDNTKKSKKKKRKAAKKRVQKTLRSIHNLLTDNLKSNPEGPTPEEEVMKEIDEAEKQKDLGAEPFESRTFDMGPINAKSVASPAASGSAKPTRRRPPKKSKSSDGIPLVPRNRPKKNLSSDGVLQGARKEKTRKTKPRRYNSSIEDGAKPSRSRSGERGMGPRTKARRERGSQSQERTALHDPRRSDRKHNPREERSGRSPHRSAGRVERSRTRSRSQDASTRRARSGSLEMPRGAGGFVTGHDIKSNHDSFDNFGRLGTALKKQREMKLWGQEPPDNDMPDANPEMGERANAEAIKQKLRDLSASQTKPEEVNDFKLGISLAESANPQRDMELEKAADRYEPPPTALDHQHKIWSPFEEGSSSFPIPNRESGENSTFPVDWETGEGSNSFPPPNGGSGHNSTFPVEWGTGEVEAGFEAHFMNESFPPPENGSKDSGSAKKDTRRRRASLTSIMADGMKDAMKVVVDSGSVVGSAMVQGGAVVGRGVVQGGSAVGRGVAQGGAAVVKASKKASKDAIKRQPDGGKENEANSQKKEKKSPIRRSNSLPTSSDQNECAVCGSTSAPEGARFCPNCGSSLMNGANSSQTGTTKKTPARRLSLGDKDSDAKETTKRLPRRTNSTGADAKKKDNNTSKKEPRGFPIRRRLSLGDKTKDNDAPRKETKKRLPRRTNSTGADVKTKDDETASKDKHAFAPLKAIGGNMKGAVMGGAKGMAVMSGAVVKASVAAGTFAGGGVGKVAKAGAKLGKGTVNASVNTSKFMRDHLSTATFHEDDSDEDDFVRKGYAELEE